MNASLHQPFVQGFLLCASLIVAFGPQNLYLLQQGLRRRYLFTTVIVCTLVDLFLIGLGVGGLGTAIAASKPLLMVATFGGAAFLFGYAVRAFCWALRGEVSRTSAEGCLSESASLTLKGTILTALSFSLLNPAAYVDTLLTIGTTSGRYPVDARMLFGVGAVMASCIWFFALTYGSSRLTPLFRRPAAWRVMNMVSGCMMAGIATSLFANQSAVLW